MVFICIILFLYAELDSTAELVSSGGLHAVPFSYGSTEASTDLKNGEAEACFRPPFPIPESLLQNLVSTWHPMKE